MLLAVDIGNTNLVFGVFAGETLRDHWRAETRAGRTADEYAVLLHGLFAMAGRAVGDLTGAIVASVVPAAVRPVCAMIERLGLRPVVVGPGLRTAMPILIENPRELGADRLVNAVAAYERCRAGCIVVDFGTATTVDVVSPRGEYLGGAIAPGLTISADALYRETAKLQRVEIVRPAAAVGKSTVTATQAGLYFGYAGLVDGLVRAMAAELAFSARVLATGGLAEVIAPACPAIQEVDPLLTLHGLRLLYERNRP